MSSMKVNGVGNEKEQFTRSNCKSGDKASIMEQKRKFE